MFRWRQTREKLLRWAVNPLETEQRKLFILPLLYSFRNSMPTKYKQFGIVLDDELKRVLEQLANKEKTSMAAVIRRLVLQESERQKHLVLSLEQLNTETGNKLLEYLILRDTVREKINIEEHPNLSEKEKEEYRQRLKRRDQIRKDALEKLSKELSGT